MDYLMLGGNDFNSVLKKQLIEIFETESNLPVDTFVEKHRKRQLYIIGEKAKKLKEDFAAPSMETAFLEIDNLELDDTVDLEIERDTYFECCNELFEKFEKFIYDFLNKVFSNCHIQCRMNSLECKLIHVSFLEVQSV